MKLRHKLSAALIASSAILAVTVLSFVLYYEYEENEEKTLTTFEAETGLLSREFTRFVHERSSDMQIALALSSLLEKKNSNEVENMLYSMRNNYKLYQNIFILDQNQIKRFDTNRIGLGEKLDYPFFNKVLAERQTIFEFYKSADTNKDVLSFAHPLTDSKGNSLGVLVCDISVNSLATLARSLTETFGGIYKKQIEIIRSDGTILYSNVRSDTSDKIFIENAKTLLPEETERYSIDNGKDYGLVTKVNVATVSGIYQEIFFVIKALKKDVNAELYHFYEILIAIFFSVTVLVHFVGIYIVKKISIPIEQAGLAVQKIGDGEFNALDSIDVTDDEYGVLITHTKEMAKKMEALIKARTAESRMVSLGEMASGIAHEINSPLQLISMHIQSLSRACKQTDPDREKMERSIKMIIDTTDRIAKIIKGLKTMTRDGAQDPFKEHELSSILENTLTICSEKLRLNGVSIQLVNSTDNLKFDCRSVQISQVVLNLINNACDAIASETEKWIRLEASTNGKMLSLRISNSGKKIPEEVAKNLFSRFFTTKAEGAGTGLGLSISLAIVNAHHGSLSVDLAAENTCFVVQLPLRQTFKS